MLLRTSDSTWQAYNAYGGNSLYSCTVSCPPGNPKAYKARLLGLLQPPVRRHASRRTTAVRSCSTPSTRLIRFVERNGYDVSYTSQVDVATNAALLLNHRLIISSGHDEYWSGPERANVEAARDAGVNLAFFSGNEVFWKTRWSRAAPTARRAEPHAHDLQGHPLRRAHRPVTWTGHLARSALHPAGDGGRPENALTGQLFVVNSGSSDIKVPAAYKNLRHLAQHRGREPDRRAERGRWAPAPTRWAMNGTSTPTTASGPPARSTCPRPPSAASSRSSTTAARPRPARRRRTT